MVTVREAHRRRVQALEAAATRMMLASLGRILAQVAARFAAMTASAEDQGNLDDLAAINAEWRAAVESEVLPWFRGVYQAGADAAEQQVTAIGLPPPAPVPELVDHAASEYLATTRNRFYRLGDTAWTAARDQLLAGFAEGEGIDQLRSRVQAVTFLSRAQAEALARTEVIGASNMGAQARIDLMGADAPPFKQWLATNDARTRPTHRHADGQVVPRGTMFEVGAARMKVPGDPSGPPEEVINCRCTVLYLETAEPIDADTPGRGQGGIVDQVARDTDGGTDIEPVAASAAVPGPPQVDTTTGEPHEGAMVALVPTAEDAQRLALMDGEPADALHLTLGYLGDAADIPDEAWDEMVAECEMISDQLGPITARVFGAAVWNATGEDPALVLSVGDDPSNDTRPLDIAHLAGSQVGAVGASVAVEWAAPENHRPWVAHVCLDYGNTEAWPVAAIAAASEGPITFDRLRLARGGEALDFPLVTDDPEEETAPMDPETEAQARELGRLVGREVAAAISQRQQLHSGGIVTIQHGGINYGISGLTAATAPTGGPAPMPGEHLRAVMHVRGEATGDGQTCRLFINTDYRDPPFSFNYQVRSSAHGGLPEVVHIGNVVRVVEEGETLYGFVTLDLESDVGADYARRSVAGIERWVSMGLDETRPASVTSIWPPMEEEDPDDDGTELQAMIPIVEIIDGGRIGELTGVSVPAQADATIEPTAELLALYGQPAPETQEPASEPVAASAATTVVTGHLDPIPPGGRAHVAVDVDAARACGCGGTCGGCGHDVTPADTVQAITAASMTITLRDLPPAEWFQEPTDVSMPGALMVNDEGRVWGMLAPAGTSHRAYVRSGRRLEAPAGNVDYSRFMGAWAPTATGLIPAGPLTMDCGHAPMLRNDHGIAFEHYDNACSIIGHVAVGENARGTWMAGALLPGVRPDQVARMLACRCSGDWQPHPDKPGWQELVACLLVPSPGFGSEHAQTTYRGEALVASSVPVRYQHDAVAVPSAAAARRAAAVVTLADAAGRNPARRVLDLFQGS